MTAEVVLEHVWGKQWKTEPCSHEMAEKQAVYRHLVNHNTISEVAAFTCRRIGFSMYDTCLSRRALPLWSTNGMCSWGGVHRHSVNTIRCLCSNGCEKGSCPCIAANRNCGPACHDVPYLCGQEPDGTEKDRTYLDRLVVGKSSLPEEKKAWREVGVNDSAAFFTAERDLVCCPH